MYIEQICIPFCGNNDVEKRITEYVHQVIELKNKKYPTEEIENKIELELCQLFGLSVMETSFINETVIRVK